MLRPLNRLSSLVYNTVRVICCIIFIISHFTLFFIYTYIFLFKGSYLRFNNSFRSVKFMFTPLILFTLILLFSYTVNVAYTFKVVHLITSFFITYFVTNTWFYFYNIYRYSKYTTAVNRF